MLEIRPANDRGISNYGWLDSRHTFSFADYYDPRQTGFSDLLVINDDRIEPGQGFGAHPHRDMEIFTYILEGALEHSDSMGAGSVIRPGDVQMMSAGTGVRHSEFNHSADKIVHLLQIWIAPDRKNVQPRYMQAHFTEAQKRGRLRLIISPDQEDGSLPIYQDARVYAGLFNGDERDDLALGQDRYAYIHVARGTLEVNGRRLAEGDGARLRGEPAIRLRSGTDAEALVFNLRPKEPPQM